VVVCHGRGCPLGDEQARKHFEELLKTSKRVPRDPSRAR
jgi:hypothetical protein